MFPRGKYIVAQADKGQPSQAQSGLFEHFPTRRLPRGLAGLDPAARQLPLEFGSAGSAFAEQDLLAVRDDDRNSAGNHS